MGQEYLASKGKAAKITIKNENAVKFIIKIDRVVFVDGSVWTKKDAVLESAGEMEDVEVFAQAKTTKTTTSQEWKKYRKTILQALEMELKFLNELRGTRIARN